MKKSELRQIIKEEIAKVLSPGESFSDFQKTDRNPNYDFPTFESIQRTMKSLHGVDVDIDTIEDYVGAANGGDGLERFGQDERVDFIQYLSKVNESYASSFGGSRNVDWEMVQDTLNREGYDTPYTGIWDQIMVEKNGVRVGKIDKSGNHYFVYPNGIYNNTTYKWAGLDGFLKQID